MDMEGKIFNFSHRHNDKITVSKENAQKSTARNDFDTRQPLKSLTSCIIDSHTIPINHDLLDWPHFEQMHQVDCEDCHPSQA